MRVMIVDDHPTLVWGLEQLIASQSPRMQVVATAHSADEAVHQASAHRPDVVLLDLDLDGRSGLDIVPVLSTQQACRVLVLTGERKPEVLDQAVRLGARGVLRKDASAHTVIKAIEKVHDGQIWLDRASMARMLGAMHRPADPERTRQAVLSGHGAANKALAARLFISEHTLRNHLSAIYHKLDVSNRLALYVYAREHRLGESAPMG
jgi:DNA-binding NarL/FixJ family response regulator